MPESALKVVRDWRRLAEQASREQDPAKLKDLVSELCDLLEKQIQRHKS
jgi:hypothetical protein